MDDAAREDLEKSIRSHCDRGDYRSAATAALRGYGPELFGFVMTLHRDAEDANDAFSEIAEALWRGLPGFTWQSSLRTWAYAIARNVSRTHRRNAARMGRRASRASESALGEVAQAVRTETLGFLKTHKRTRLEALRDSLEPDDRTLLVLRVDRKLPWRDLALVLWEGDDAPDETALAREAARLRKRFQIVKDRLRDLARKEGLLDWPITATASRRRRASRRGGNRRRPTR
jgi:RNA polymerase sigma-70 factor, ECF subfamily